MLLVFQGWLWEKTVVCAPPPPRPWLPGDGAEASGRFWSDTIFLLQPTSKDLLLCIYSCLKLSISSWAAAFSFLFVVFHILSND